MDVKDMKQRLLNLEAVFSEKETLLTDLESLNLVTERRLLLRKLPRCSRPFGKLEKEFIRRPEIFC